MMLASNVVERMLGSLDCSPWANTSGVRVALRQKAEAEARKRGLYTPEERRRRDATPWTMVQGVLAPVQFAVFLVSLGLVLSYLATGDGHAAASASIVLKTVVLYTIMVTGCFWERAVFGRFLFAPAFYWEDVFSMLVLALHTAYLAAITFGFGTTDGQMWLALAAYAAYLVNATQFVLKLRAARREGEWQQAATGAGFAK